MTLFFFSSRRRHTRWPRDWSSDVCSSDLSSINEFLELGIRKAEQLQNYPELKANIYSVIGQIYRKTGDLDQAGYLLNNAWLINKNLYGENHPETLAVVEHYGLLLINIGEIRKAEELLEH